MCYTEIVFKLMKYSLVLRDEFDRLRKALESDELTRSEARDHIDMCNQLMDADIHLWTAGHSHLGAFSWVWEREPDYVEST